MKTNRILALAFAVILMAVMVFSVNAATNDGKITVTNPVENEEYTLYKIFDVPYYTETSDEPPVLDKVAYTYPAAGNADFITALLSAGSPFDAELNGDVYSISLKDGKDETHIEAFIKDNLAYLTLVNTQIATGTTVEFEDLPYGYYFVTTTVGSFATIDTAAKVVEIEEKNTMPTIEKEIKEDSTATWGETADYSICDDILYRAIVTIGKGNDKDITLTDTLENQIFNETSVAIEGWTVGGDYTVSFNADKTVMTIVLKEDAVKAHTESDVVLTYSAKFDKTAADLTKAAGNDNTIVLEYSNLTRQDSTKVKTYQFDLVKTDGDNKLLKGAQFSLWTASTAGSQIGLIYDNTLAAYRPVVAGETAAPIDMTTVANVRIYGLDADNYYLQEDVAPAGFNKLTTRNEVALNANNDATVTADAWTSGGVHIINNAGTVLPSTGGTGTVIFTIVGSVLVLAAGLFIVTNKKMSKENI